MSAIEKSTKVVKTKSWNFELRSWLKAIIVIFRDTLDKLFWHIVLGMNLPFFYNVFFFGAINDTPVSHNQLIQLSEDFSHF